MLRYICYYSTLIAAFLQAGKIKKWTQKAPRSTARGLGAYAVLSDGMRLICKICMVCIHALSLGVALLEELGRDLREHGVGQNVLFLSCLLYTSDAADEL